MLTFYATPIPTVGLTFPGMIAPSPGQSHREPGPRMADDLPSVAFYTGVAIFGAVGSGKTSACMHPVRAPTLELASNESRAARGGARP